MILLVETVATLWVLVGSWLAAERLVRSARPWRWMACAGAALLLVAVAVLRRRPEWALGPLELVVRTPGVGLAYALAVPMALLIPVAQLRHERERRGVRMVAALVAFWLGLGPLLAPHLSSAFYADIPTLVDADGVVLQRENFTCGPAAAASALRSRGQVVATAELARLARTNPWFGTPPAELAQAVRAVGAEAHFRRWADLDALADVTGVPLLVVRHSMVADHWVAWMGRDADGRHILHDPAFGLRRLEPKALAERWYGYGLEVAPGSQSQR